MIVGGNKSITNWRAIKFEIKQGNQRTDTQINKNNNKRGKHPEIPEERVILMSISVRFYFKIEKTKQTEKKKNLSSLFFTFRKKIYSSALCVIAKMKRRWEFNSLDGTAEISVLFFLFREREDRAALSFFF